MTNLVHQKSKIKKHGCKDLLVWSKKEESVEKFLMYLEKWHFPQFFPKLSWISASSSNVYTHGRENQFSTKILPIGWVRSGVPHPLRRYCTLKCHWYWLAKQETLNASYSYRFCLEICETSLFLIQFELEYHFQLNSVT